MLFDAEAMEHERCPARSVLLTLLGNTLGFYQVEASPDHAMAYLLEVEDFSETERYHARLALALGRGAPYTDDPRAVLQARANR